MRALADQLDELNLILGGEVKQPSQHLAQQNRTTVLWAINETKALRMFKALVGDRGRFTPQDFNLRFGDEKIPPHDRIAQFVQNVETAAGYVGSESCASCHATVYKVWEQSEHAHAF